MFHTIVSSYTANYKQQMLRSHGIINTISLHFNGVMDTVDLSTDHPLVEWIQNGKLSNSNLCVYLCLHCYRVRYGQCVMLSSV